MSTENLINNEINKTNTVEVNIESKLDQSSNELSQFLFDTNKLNINESTNNDDLKYTQLNNLIDKNKNFSDPDNSILIHLFTDQGTRIEIYPIPLEYTVSDVEFLIIEDTGLEKKSFDIVYQNNVLEPSIKMNAIANEDNFVECQLKLLKTDSQLFIFKLGLREITLSSGLTFRLIGRKVNITSDPSSREDIMITKGISKYDYINIKWLPLNHRKPFLGGYRNTLNNNIYHNACVQTKPPTYKKPEHEVFSRDTQTYKMRHFGQMTNNQMSTQFSKPGFYVANYKDQILTAGPYETADEYLARILRMIIIIQKYIRKWLAKRKVEKLKKLKNDILAWEKAHTDSLDEKRAKKLAFDLEHRLHPKTAADFDSLYNALETWRINEVAKIQAQPITKAEKKAELALLLDKETEFINAITRHQICVTKRNAESNQIALLKKSAAPHKWISSRDGHEVEVATPETIRGKELLDIFETLCAECLVPNERMDILLTVKKTVSQYNNKTINEILNLVEREADLMLRGIPNEQLVGLRQRIRNRFMQFAKLPEVNPELSKHLVINSKSKHTQSLNDLHHCPSCDKYKKSKAFPLGAKAKTLAPCKACRQQDNRARKRLNLEPYQYILLELMQNEIKLMEKLKNEAILSEKESELDKLEGGKEPDEQTMTIFDESAKETITINPFPFLLNKEDIRFIIDELWERRSVLSGCLDIIDLTLCRWIKEKPWSPWNTMLITRKESDAHLNLGRLSNDEAYSDTLINIVNQRLIMGRNAFHKLYKNGFKMSKEVIQEYESIRKRTKIKNNKVLFSKPRIPNSANTSPIK